MSSAAMRSRVRSQLRGAAGTRKMIRRLPAAAKAEMAEILEDAGPDLLSAMKRDVAVRTGALSEGLSFKLLRASLRLRVGLISKAANRRLYYGLIVEVGRKAQTVTIRSGPRAGARMRVRAMAPRPFVYKRRPDERGTLRRRLDTFWELALAHAAEGADFNA